MTSIGNEGHGICGDAISDFEDDKAEVEQDPDREGAAKIIAMAMAVPMAVTMRVAMIVMVSARHRPLA